MDRSVRPKSKTNMINRYVHPVLDCDVEYVARHMRPADIKEVEALGYSPLDALRASVKASPHVHTIVEPNTGYPAAILGVADPKIEGLGVIWMLGTELISEYPQSFLRNSRPTLEQLFVDTNCKTFYNVVHSENSLHIKWLKWLGFTLSGDHVKVNGHRFIPFHKHH